MLGSEFSTSGIILGDHRFATGVMTGTSADGIDAVLVEVGAWQVVRHHHVPYAQSLRAPLLDWMQGASMTVDAYLDIEADWTLAVMDVVFALWQLHGIEADDVAVVGVHGQTLRHRPEGSIPTSWQLTNPHPLRAAWGVPVVTDFRRADMAYGGQGAPLVPLFQQVLWQSKAPLLWVNLGGICNVTVLRSNAPVLGFDVVPGNALLDAWAHYHLGVAFDAEGAWGASGQVLPALERRLRSALAPIQQGPHSLCRGDYTLAWLKEQLSGDERPEDVQATLMAWMAGALAEACQPYADSQQVVFSGGGVLNTAWYEQLRAVFSPSFQVETLEALGWEATTLEAAAFAWLAYQRCQGVQLETHSVTGAKGAQWVGVLHP